MMKSWYQYLFASASMKEAFFLGILAYFLEMEGCETRGYPRYPHVGVFSFRYLASFHNETVIYDLLGAELHLGWVLSFLIDHLVVEGKYKDYCDGLAFFLGVILYTLQMGTIICDGVPIRIVKHEYCSIKRYGHLTQFDFVQVHDDGQIVCFRVIQIHWLSIVGNEDSSNGDFDEFIPIPQPFLSI